MSWENKNKPAAPEDISLYSGLDNLPPELWTDLTKLKSEDVCRRAGIKCNQDGAFILPFLGVDHEINPAARTILVPGGCRKPGFQAGLVLLNYLIHASDEGLSGKMAAERELNGGELFFKGPHALNKEPIVKKFGANAAGLLARAKIWGASETAGGDAAFKILALPKVLIGYTFYEADDEFEAEASITFDASIDKHLPLDSIWALINVMSARLAEEG